MDPSYYYDPYYYYDVMADLNSQLSDVQGRASHKSSDESGDSVSWVDPAEYRQSMTTNMQNMMYMLTNFPQVLRQVLLGIAPIKFVPAGQLSDPTKIIVPVPLQVFKPFGVGSNNIAVNFPLN